MNDSWDERRRAQEEGYFERANKEALLRLAAKKTGGVRKSPVTGKPMEQLAVQGVVIDRCADSGGVWLDKGELEQIMNIAKETPSAVQGFIQALLEVPGLSEASADQMGSAGELKSPISGSPMHGDNLFGVPLYRCPDSGGLWIDARKLSEMLKSLNATQMSSVMDFISSVLHPK